jgi:phosphoglycerate kinase
MAVSSVQTVVIQNVVSKHISQMMQNATPWSCVFCYIKIKSLSSFCINSSSKIHSYCKNDEIYLLTLLQNFTSRNMNQIDDYQFKGKRVLIRVDFNVPLNENREITDDTRIVTAIPTIQKVLTDGGSVIIMTHLGRPSGKEDDSLSVRHISSYLEQILGREIIVADDCIGPKVENLSSKLKPGQVLLLENLRFYKEETQGDEEFAKSLSKLGDTYINNAFGTAHRAHASTYTIAKFFPYDKMLGYLVESEIKNIDKLLKKAKSPFTAIIGGAKISTKINIIEALMEKVDNLIIGGGIVFTFLKAKGLEVGNSLVDDNYIDVAKRILETAKERNVKIYLPEDVLIANEFSNEAQIEHVPVTAIKPGWMGMDIGVKSAELFEQVIEDSESILWNGPMGVFEMPHFAYGTLKTGLSVSRATDKGSYSLVGGGDSIAALKKYALEHKISYVSTAGGALLEYIEGKKLPSLRAIKETYSIDDYDFRGKRALVRVDFNVPMDENFKITDDTRIRTAIPTIRKIMSEGASVILLTHIGRPKGQRIDKYSVRHIIPYISQLLGTEVKFADRCRGDNTEKLTAELKPGEVMILENLRFTNEEIEGSEKFAEELSRLGDVYINNAFGTAHRAHASTYTIAKFFPEDKMLGYLIENEMNNINRILHKSEHPFTTIIGGSKISTKIDIIKALMDKVDNLIIGGGIAFTFIKAMGGQIGDSLVEDDALDKAREILDYAARSSVKLYLPTDCLIADSLDKNPKIRHSKASQIPEGWRGLDIGVKTAETYTKIIENSNSILWNGPMGVFEMPYFSNGTIKIALATARATDMGAFSLVGGGDSIAALKRYGMSHKISYISTAGGALLEYIEGKELPSLKAIRTKI